MAPSTGWDVTTSIWPSTRPAFPGARRRSAASGFCRLLSCCSCGSSDSAAARPNCVGYSAVALGEELGDVAELRLIPQVASAVLFVLAGDVALEHVALHAPLATSALA